MANTVSKALGEKFSFTIANATGATKVLAILAAYFDTLLCTATQDAGGVITVVKKWTDASQIVAAGFVCDHVIDDGTLETNLTVTAANSKMSVRAFREYIKNGGRILIDLSIQANNVDVFNKSFEVVKCTPTKGSAPDYLSLADFYSVDQTSSSKINARDVQLEMDANTLLLLPVDTGRTITVTFYFQ